MASFLATQILHPKHSCCPRTGSLTSGPSAPGVLLPQCVGEGAGEVTLEQNTRNMERMCLVCIFILVNLLEMLNTVWGAHAMVKVWKKTSLSVTWGLAPYVHELVMTSILCHGERNVSCPKRLFWVFNIVSEALYCQKRFVLLHISSTWSGSSADSYHPAPRSGPWCQLLSRLWCFVFSCELLCAEHPQMGDCCLSDLSSICILHVVLLTT